jgi:hypothetical protein
MYEAIIFSVNFRKGMQTKEVPNYDNKQSSKAISASSTQSINSRCCNV